MSDSVDLTVDVDAAAEQAAEDIIGGHDLPEVTRFVDWEEKYKEVVAELQEARQECVELISTCADKEGTITELRETVAKYKKLQIKFVADHGNFMRGVHELNHLRETVQDLQNLNITVKDAFAHPEDLALIMAMEPAKRKAKFTEPLREVPKGAWGSKRIIKVGQNPTTGLAEASTEDGDHYVSTAFAKYRTAFGYHLANHRLFKCATCAHPLHHSYKWCMCMRCLAVPYCSIACLGVHKPGHFCSLHHVWTSDIPQPQDAAKGPVSSSSTSTSSAGKRKAPASNRYPDGPAFGQHTGYNRSQYKGGQSKGSGTYKGKGKGQINPADNCRSYLRDGVCNNSGCRFTHDVHAYMANQPLEARPGSYQGRDANQGDYDPEEDQAEQF
jgi:hypothetical protein